MCRYLPDQRDVSFFYLAVISYANSTCKVKIGEDVPQKFPSQRDRAMSGSVIKTFADERLLASTSVFHFYPAIALGWLSRETLLFLRHIQAPDYNISLR